MGGYVPSGLTLTRRTCRVTWHWGHLSLLPTQVSVPGDTALCSCGGSREGISQRILHNHRKNEIIYNLLKKFLLDGDGFLFGPVGLHSTPTLHPVSCSGFPRSPDSSSRIVVVRVWVVLCIREGFDFGGCWVIGWLEFCFLLR